MSNEGPRFASTDLFQVRRNPWMLGLAASPLLLTFAAIVAGLTLKPEFFAITFHPAIVAGLLVSLAWRSNWRAIIERADVRADATGVHVGERFIPREQIREGFVLPGAPPRVKLRLRRAFPVDLRVASTAEGRDLLRALGLDVSQTVATFRTGSRALAKRRYMAGFVGSFFALYATFVTGMARAHNHPASGPIAAVIFAVGLIGLLLVTAMPTKLSVGADGIVLSWFGRKRFIGYGEIDVVTRYDKGWGRSRQVGLNLLLRSGEEVLIPIGQPKWSEENVAIIEERMEEAMTAFKSGDAATDAALLRRGDRPLGDWVSALRAIGSGANADMRTAPLPRERLFRIVESPTAGAAERAAAAVAIGAELDDDARARLRSAADAIAAPKLRIVLEAAAEGKEQAEIEAALAEIEAEERKTA